MSSGDNQFDLKEHSHRRLNILTNEWVQVSPHRAKRPWQGQVEKTDSRRAISYEPGCYLCPGNKRSNGEINPDYDGTFSFNNDFSAIVPDVPDGTVDINNVLVAKSEKGICRVICFSPRHDLTLPEMEIHQIHNIVKLWMREFDELSSIPYINYVQIFENKGAVMGCSNPHPHGQIWAQESIPMEPHKKHVNQLSYFTKHQRTLLSDYMNIEKQQAERIVAENDYFMAVVPFWATWPFELMIIPKRPMAYITQMSEAEVGAFSDILKIVTVKYDNLFETSFPYSAGIHQAPTDGLAHDEWHWHMVFYPPLLRSASVKKFMVGYEMLANPQRDITPEYSAAKLRELPAKHYKLVQASIL
jgi:UDPglucose--hexose-1-phosphate uridylyltransferase